MSTLADLPDPLLQQALSYLAQEDVAWLLTVGGPSLVHGSPDSSTAPQPSKRPYGHSHRCQTMRYVSSQPRFLQCSAVSHRWRALTTLVLQTDTQRLAPKTHVTATAMVRAPLPQSHPAANAAHVICSAVRLLGSLLLTRPIPAWS